MLLNLRKYAAPALVALSLAACSNEQSTSQVLVTSVDHTIVKRQSIGNCWIYAQATWLESLIYTAQGEELDVSESYWTWWHWYDQIVGSSGAMEIETGGFWSISNDILLQRGWVLEGEFIAAEDGDEMSLAQSRALNHMNNALKSGGALAKKTDRTPENVRRELDLAFGATMADAEAVARDAEDTIIGKTEDGDVVTAYDALAGERGTLWNEVSFPRVYGKDTKPSERQQRARKELLVRVMRALNDHQPVVMSLMIDFNALDRNDQTFKASLLEENGRGSQGGHMVVLNDYVVDNVPGFGKIGEGDVSDEMKEAALQGDLVHLQAKNSWGKNRADRGLTDGFTRFDYDYLTKQLEWEGGFFGTTYFTTLTDFVLPPGY